MGWMLVTPEEDRQLTPEMQTEFEHVHPPVHVLRFPVPYSRERNPSKEEGMIQRSNLAPKTLNGSYRR